MKPIDYGMGVPSFRREKPLPLTELSPEPLRAGMPAGTPIKAYKLGDCTVIITHNNRTTWHMSIACHWRYPTWNEIAEARYRLMPADITMALLLPPESEYVNVHKNCFQLIEIPDPEPTGG
jgi:hypothetical protein